MTSKDSATEPPQKPGPSPAESKPAGSDAEWPKLLARVVEGIVTSELHEFEDNVMAFLDSAAANAYATLIWMGARAIGAAFLLTALILLLGNFLPWWETFGSAGVVVIAVGALASLRRSPQRRRSRR